MTTFPQTKLKTYQKYHICQGIPSKILWLLLELFRMKSEVTAVVFDKQMMHLVKF